MGIGMREKLIKVLDVIGSCNAKYCCDCEFAEDIEGCVRRQKEIIADHLIANGVFVLPCSYGKTIYVVESKKIVECEIDEISFGVCGLMYLVSFECDSECDGCPFNSWEPDYSGEWSCDGEYNQAAVNGCDFGKTVFLTREDAEAALAKKDGERRTDNE